MSEQFYTILTKQGKAKIANATALGDKVNLSKFQVGDGGGNYYNPSEDQTKLRNKVWEGKISSITIDKSNPNWIILEVIIPHDVGGFMIREAGVFDDNGNLMAIGKYPETYKPVVADGSTKDLIIKMILEVSNTSSVTLKVDPTVILATQRDIQELRNNITQNLPIYEICKIQHNLDSYPMVNIFETEYGAGIGKVGEVPCGGTASTTIDYKVQYLDRNNLSILTKSLYKKYGKANLVKINKQNYILNFSNSNKSLMITLGGM